MVHEIPATPIGICGRHRCFPGGDAGRRKNTPAHSGVSGAYDNIVPLIIVTAYVLSAEASIFMCDPPQWSAKDTHYRYRLSELCKYPPVSSDTNAPTTGAP